MAKKDYKTITLDPKYTPKKTEEYMSDEQRAFFYQMLSTQRAELMSAMSDVTSDINVIQKIDAAGGGDDEDIGSMEQETNMQLRLHERNSGLLKKIDAALLRLENGTYGYSVISGDEIGIKRLMARPLATMTLEEQEDKEQNE